MRGDDFASSIRGRIERACEAGGHRLGWRLLYGPADTMDAARAAFIGLNPGGRGARAGHGEFAMAPGRSAYVHERWGPGHAPGQAPLQRQVRALFARLNLAPHHVLAGNLVPFRSPDWASLPGKADALAFGGGLWRDILARARPALVIAMGGAVFRALAGILGAGPVHRTPVGWGRVCARHAKFGAATAEGGIEPPSAVPTLRAGPPGARGAGWWVCLICRVSLS